MTQSIGAAPLLANPYPAPAGVTADPSDAARIAATVQQLRGTSAGREVADFLAANRVEIRVLPDADFARSYPGAGAVYDVKTKLISVPAGSLDRGSFVTTLAHEGKHALDFADRPHWAAQTFGMVGGSAGDALEALVTLRNPMTAWLDSVTARQNEDEVTAYRLQAQVAAELGRNEGSWALGQARDGTPLSIDEIRGRVATADLYRMDPNRRLLLAGGLGMLTTSLAGAGAQALATKLRPGSYLASHGWPAYAVGGALTGAWVLADQVRARRLDHLDPD